MSLLGFPGCLLCPKGFAFLQEKVAQAGCRCSPRALCEHHRMLPKAFSLQENSLWKRGCELRDSDLCQPCEMEMSVCFNSRDGYQEKC